LPKSPRLPKLMLILPFYFLQRRDPSCPVGLVPNVRGAEHTLCVGHRSRSV
jgi:hypothetical protein